MMPLSNTQEALLSIVRQSLWGKVETIPSADWEQVDAISYDQGVRSLLYSGVSHKKSSVPLSLLRDWRAAMIASVLRSDEINAEQTEILNALDAQGIDTVVLKGTSISRLYPHPDTRTLGDIDLLVDPQQQDTVNAILLALGYECHDHDHAFHVNYRKGNVEVEVHHAVSEVPDLLGENRAKTEMTAFLQKRKMVNCNGMTFPSLSDSHQALMLLLHMERHMLEGGIGLRQMCDLAVFVAKSAPQHWGEYTLSLLHQCGLLVYAKVITKACVQYLGLSEESASWCMDASDSLSGDMIQDVFRGGNLGLADTGNSSDLFTDRSSLGDDKHNVVKGLINTLNKRAYVHFPFTQKHKFLLPIFWVFLPARYIIRSWLGLRPAKNVLNAFNLSNRLHLLYKSLHLYEVK